MDGELLDGVNGGEGAGAALCGKGRGSAACTFVGGRCEGKAEVGTDTVDGEIVRAGALAVDGELALVGESGGGHDDAGGEVYGVWKVRPLRG